MGKNKSASGLTNFVQYDNQGNIYFVSGSNTLMSISSSGAITTTGVISGSNALSSSFALTSTTAATASSVANLNQNVQVTGSLGVTSTITAQTLVVQTVTSSIVYSSGSNIFGNSISNTQTFTGSVLVTGSVGIGITPSPNSSTLLQLFDPVATRLRLQTTGSSAGALDFYNGSTAQWSVVVDSSQGYGKIENRILSTDAIRFYSGSNNVILTPSAGSVGIGGTPSYTLDVYGTGRFSGNLSVTSTYGFTIGAVSGAARIQYGSSASDAFTFLTTGNGFANLYAGTGTFSSNVSATQGIFSQSAGQTLQAYQTSATNATTAIIRQTGAGGNGGQDIGLVVDIQAAGDQDRIANFRYYNGSTYTSRMSILRGGGVGIGIEVPNSTTKLHIVSSTGNASDNTGLLLLESTYSSGTGQSNNASLVTKNYYGYSQFMQWDYYGVRLGSRGTANGGGGAVYITYSTDGVGIRIDSGGSVYNAANTTTWQQASDRRIKQNIRPVNDALTKLCALNPSHFEYKTNLGVTKTGFIAQEFEQVFPGHVYERKVELEYQDYFEEGEMMKVLDPDLLPYLVKAMQELKAELDAAKAEIELLKQR